MNKRNMVAAALLLLAGFARADGWQHGIDVGGGLFFTHMDEVQDGHAVVTEKGLLPEGLVRVYAWQGPLELGASLHSADGTVDYYGESQNRFTLASQPYNTTTASAFADVQLDAALRFEHWRFKAFTGYNLWLRDVQSKGGVSGATEDYRWFTPGLGVSYRYPLQGGMALEPGLDLWASVHVRQAAANGIDDTAHLEPAARPGGRLSLTVSRPLRDGLGLRLIPWIQMFEFGQSKYVLTTINGQQQYISGQPEAAYQPTIRYVQAGLRVEVENSF